jgi:hypothetical protein
MPKPAAILSKKKKASSTSICHSGTELFWTSERIRLVQADTTSFTYWFVVDRPYACIAQLVLLHFNLTTF